MIWWKLNNVAQMLQMAQNSSLFKILSYWNSLYFLRKIHRILQSKWFLIKKDTLIHISKLYLLVRLYIIIYNEVPEWMDRPKLRHELEFSIADQRRRWYTNISYIRMEEGWNKLLKCIAFNITNFIYGI